MLPPDAVLPLLDISGTSGTLSSDECEITFDVALPSDTEGPIAFTGVDSTQCAEGTLSLIHI